MITRTTSVDLKQIIKFQEMEPFKQKMTIRWSNEKNINSKKKRLSKWNKSMITVWVKETMEKNGGTKKKKNFDT